jgi:hypothetical protein
MSAASGSPLPLELRPFPGQEAPAGLQLTAAASWRLEPVGVGALALRWRLQGDLGALLLPHAAAAPERRDGLWEHTCFEAFLGRRGEESYQELNVSPAGHWNLYRLAGYRSGLRPDPSLAALASRRCDAPDLLELALELPASLLPALPGELELAITAVLQQRDGRCSFWALAHSGAEPDFHRRESFVHSL